MADYIAAIRLGCGGRPCRFSAPVDHGFCQVGCNGGLRACRTLITLPQGVVRPVCAQVTLGSPAKTKRRHLVSVKRRCVGLSQHGGSGGNPAVLLSPG